MKSREAHFCPVFGDNPECSDMNAEVLAQVNDARTIESNWRLKLRLLANN